MVKRNARDVPPYPEPSESLRDVARWPATRMFEGKLYTLKFGASSSDVVKDAKTLADVPKGWDHSAHYEGQGTAGRWTFRGPSYTWHADGSLFAREYYDSANACQAWTYDRKGRLGMYSFDVKESSLGPMAVVEYFAIPTGDLVALIFDHKSYWMGAEVSNGERMRRLRELRHREGVR